jgi:glycerophosphoryl diester phosphodiesterase
LYDLRWLQPIIHYLAKHHRAMAPVHFIFRQFLPIAMKKLAHEQIDAVIIRSPFISSRLVEVAHQTELELYAWPADKPEDAARLHKLGVDGIASNKPDVFEAVKLAHQ